MMVSKALVVQRVVLLLVIVFSHVLVSRERASRPHCEWPLAIQVVIRNPCNEAIHTSPVMDQIMDWGPCSTVIHDWIHDWISQLPDFHDCLKLKPVSRGRARALVGHRR